MISPSQVKRTHKLHWFEVAVAYCDVCEEMEIGHNLFQVSSTGQPAGKVWVKAVLCGDHAQVVVGQTLVVHRNGVDFE